MTVCHVLTIQHAQKTTWLQLDTSVVVLLDILVLTVKMVRKIMNLVFDIFYLNCLAFYCCFFKLLSSDDILSLQTQNVRK